VQVPDDVPLPATWTWVGDPPSGVYVTVPEKVYARIPVNVVGLVSVDVPLVHVVVVPLAFMQVWPLSSVAVSPDTVLFVTQGLPPPSAATLLAVCVPSLFAVMVMSSV
jgi:hypothetical protein